MPIYMYGKENNWEQYEVKTIGELLPMSFGPNDMEKRENKPGPKFG